VSVKCYVLSPSSGRLNVCQRSITCCLHLLGDCMCVSEVLRAVSIFWETACVSEMLRAVSIFWETACLSVKYYVLSPSSWRLHVCQ
jgi:hypothetical protein